MSTQPVETTSAGPRPGLTPEQQAAEALKQDLRQRLADCRQRRDSARRLAKSQRRRDALVLLESISKEMLGVFASLENGSAAEHAPAANALQDVDAAAALGRAENAAAQCRETERLSRQERRSLRKLDKVCVEVLALGERRFAEARRGSLKTPMDGRKARSRLTGSLVLAVILGIAALVLWGPLGNILGPNSVNLVQELESDLVRVDGLTGREQSQVVSWRWGLGPETRLAFRLKSDQPVRLTLRFVSYLYQDVTVAANGETLAVIDHVFPEGIVEQVFEIDGREGVNEIVIAYGDWNHRADNAPLADDPRPLAVAFVKLTLSAESPLLAID